MILIIQIARQANAERIAINTRVQGSAADIIKKAMVMLDPIMREIDSMLVLQVHDELVFDVTDSEYQSLIPRLVEVMEGAVSIQVPLLVDVESGASWGRNVELTAIVAIALVVNRAILWFESMTLALFIDE